MKDKREQREVYSHKVRAGKRTYIFDVRATRSNDFYITITERKRQRDGEPTHKQKLFLYKEDFNKFMGALEDVLSHVKDELMPEYDFERYDKLKAEGLLSEAPELLGKPEVPANDVPRED